MTDRMSIQEGTIYAMKIMSKDEILSLMDRLHTLESSMRALEQNTGQEIQTLQKIMVNRFEKIEEIIKFDDQEQKVGRQNLTLSVRKTLQDSFPRVLLLPAFPVIISEKVAGSKYPKAVKEYTWEPIHMTDLKEIKQEILNYGLHPSFFREMVKTWAFSNKATPTTGLS